MGVIFLEFILEHDLWSKSTNLYNCDKSVRRYLKNTVKQTLNYPELLKHAYQKILNKDLLLMNFIKKLRFLLNNFIKINTYFFCL